MGSFVDPKATVEIAEFDPAVVISDTTPRVIVIRAKMDYATQKHVQGMAWKIGQDGKGAELDFGDSLMELLVVNIKAWRGGDLDGVPCDGAHIRMLDPTDPFIQRVADEIGERNKPKASPDPKSPGTNGSTSDGSTASSTRPDEAPNISLQLATSTSRSPVQNILAGRLNKSENSTPTT